MKITVFNGSPRGEQSNTNIMVKEFAQGATEAGAEVENIFLVKNEIKPCMGCFACWTKTPGKCVINDDMAELIDKMIDSDIVVYACPVYVGSVTGIMKNFIDRSLPMADPHFKQSAEGLTCHYSRHDGEHKVVLMSNCGFPEMEHFDYFRTVFLYMQMNSEMNILAEIYRSQGEMLKIDNPFINLVTAGYKKTLRHAGREIVENQCLSDKTIAELKKDLVPKDIYLSEANKHWDQMLSNIKS